VLWSDFVAVDFGRHTFIGHFKEEAWNKEEDEEDSSYNPFVSCDTIVPSRFVLAFEPNLDAAFIAQDQEKVGPFLTDNRSTDLGDDVLQYKKGKPTFEKESLIHPNLASFLKMDL
jgi:hypothetical protein